MKGELRDWTIAMSAGWKTRSPSPGVPGFRARNVWSGFTISRFRKHGEWKTRGLRGKRGLQFFFFFLVKIRIFYTKMRSRNFVIHFSEICAEF